MDKINLFLNNLPRVLNDDGGIAEKPSAVVISNAEKFFKSLPSYYQKIIDISDCVTATGYGTITFDWYYRKNFISVEVGNTLIGWFSELPDGTNPSSNGVSVDLPPTQIVSALNKIYGRKDI